MNSSLQAEIISREMVKPSSPTPKHQKIHALCFFEQISSTIYVPFVFFYAKDTCPDRSHISYLLKGSLSETLSKYYPLAGRLKDSVTVDCNDEGIEFFETRINCDLSYIFKNPNAETIKILIPNDLEYKDPFLSSLVIVQVNFFDCGGMGLTVCISHKIADMATLYSFINNWAAIARNSGKEYISPLFNLGSLYPPIDLPVMSYEVPEKVKCISRRIIFDFPKIAILKSIIAKEIQDPTRVEVVTALIYKSAISAAKTVSRSLKPTILHQAIHLRSWVSPPVPENAMGCLTGIFPVPIMDESEIHQLAQLVRQTRQGKIRFREESKKKLVLEEFYSFILECSKGVRESQNKNIYMCSSLCGFSFYVADFGWGKPTWVTHSILDARNIIMLIDTREGNGIEAYVSLEENEMAVFESNKELLAFAKINPTVSDSQILGSRL
ncbi:hypothetical protein JCGZ_17901 [Jatropha curcas]|uniref:BAHD acyltransferase n=1 Tax=Jatropha curcas TaxID=180498 RepID=A0A067JVD6_JATCU|nr:acylsugar acyltransferase 3 [Jatropha curcas]KDP26743.1 hypothetical protein JCGZ_17901 [Jatropha curcas]